MSAPVIHRACDCCRELIHGSAFQDSEIGVICDDCRKQARAAVAWMKRPSVQMPGGAVLPINIQGCFKGEAAGDNQPPPA